jgi:polysaccharide biosynthesis/export protein
MNNLEGSDLIVCQKPEPRERARCSRLAFGVCLAMLVSFVTACQSPALYPPDSTLNPIDAAVQPMSSTLREGDVIQVTFATATNLNTSQRIQLDGEVAMPFVGKVKVLGKTPEELGKSLEKLYESQLRGAEQITVTVASSAAAVYVTGAVLRPGKIPLDRPFTVLDAIMEAGGANDTRAKLSSVMVLRVEGGQRVTRRVNLKRALEGKDPSLFYLKPYDIVYVPEKVVNF